MQQELQDLQPELVKTSAETEKLMVKIEQDTVRRLILAPFMAIKWLFGGVKISPILAPCLDDFNGFSVGLMALNCQYG